MSDFGQPARDEKGVAAAIGVNPFFAKDYLAAVRNYNYEGIEQGILLLQAYNLKSVGVGSANKGFSLRNAATDLRSLANLTGATTLRREGAPIPMKPLRRWDNGRDVVLAGEVVLDGAPAPLADRGKLVVPGGGERAQRDRDRARRPDDRVRCVGLRAQRQRRSLQHRDRTGRPYRLRPKHSDRPQRRALVVASLFLNARRESGRLRFATMPHP